MGCGTRSDPTGWDPTGWRRHRLDPTGWECRHPPAAVERGLEELLVDQPHQPQVLLRRGRRGEIVGRAVEVQKFALTTNAQMIMMWVDSARFWSTAAGKPFFQPLDLHVEPADLLVEFGLEGLPVVAVAAAAIAEEGLDAVEELLLPLTDLDGVDLVRLGEFGDGLGLLGGLQGDLGLEGGRMAFLCRP